MVGMEIIMKSVLRIVCLMAMLSTVTYAQGPIQDGNKAMGDKADRKETFRKQRMERQKGTGGPFERAIRMLENRPEVAEHLGISESQVASLKRVRETSKENQKALQHARAQARKNLNKLMTSDQPSRSEVMQAIETLGQADTALKKEQMSTLLEIREILGKEVFRKIQQRTGQRDRSEMREKMRKRRAGMGQEEARPPFRRGPRGMGQDKSLPPPPPERTDD